MAGFVVAIAGNCAAARGLDGVPWVVTHFDPLGLSWCQLLALPKTRSESLIAAMIESLAEAFALVRKSGIDPQQYLEILTSSLFAAPMYKTYGTLIAQDKCEPVGLKY